MIWCEKDDVILVSDIRNIVPVDVCTFEFCVWMPKMEGLTIEDVNEDQN